jgi:hypothetical protein
MKKSLLFFLVMVMSFLGLAACSEMATVAKCVVRDHTNRPCS